MTRAGLQFFTLILARACLRKQGCECLSPDGAKYFHTSLPQSLSLCITARKRYGRKIRAASRRRGQVTPNLQLYFQASQLNYSANPAPRKISTGSHQVLEHSTDELHSAAALVADVAALCRGSQLPWGSPCVSVCRVFWLFWESPARAQDPIAVAVVAFFLAGTLCVCSQKWDMQEDTASHALSWVPKREGEGVGRTWGVLCSCHLLCPEAGESLWKCSPVPVCSSLHLT